MNNLLELEFKVNETEILVNNTNVSEKAAGWELQGFCEISSSKWFRGIEARAVDWNRCYGLLTETVVGTTNIVFRGNFVTFEAIQKGMLA